MRITIHISTVLRKSVRIFHNKKIDMYIFLIKVNCKSNLENSFGKLADSKSQEREFQVVKIE